MRWEPRWRAQARDSFAARFEQDRESYLFRATPTAAPVRVAAAEVDRATREFLRGQLRLMLGMIIGVVVAIVLLAVIEPDADRGSAGVDWSIWGLVAVSVGVFLLCWLRLWNAPARAWARRAPAGIARDKHEAARRQFASRSWLQMVAVGGGGAVLVVSHLLDRGSSTAEHWGWGGFALFLIVCVAIGVWRKWSSERPA